MTEMLELSDCLFKMITTDVLRTLTEKVNNMQEHMDIISREMGSLRKNEKKPTEVRKTVTNEECLRLAHH